MSIPIRLKPMADFADPALLAEVKLQLQLHGTACEVLKCTEQAVSVYRNDWSVIFMCNVHLAMTKAPHRYGTTKNSLDKALTEYMYGGLLRKSYVYMNNQSGFVLEALVEEFVKQGDDRRRRAARTEVLQQADLRRQMRESNVKIGAPDDELMSSRQRNDLRKIMGQPMIGNPRKEAPTTSVASAELVESFAPPLDFAAKTATQLPFPEIQFI